MDGLNSKINVVNYPTLDQILNDINFPTAIDPVFIAREDSDEDRQIRAESILDLWFKEPIENKKILDFGCGQGHLCEEINRRKGNAFGYDIIPIDKENTTTSFDKVLEKAPYDYVILYDVLDHAQENPHELLIKSRMVLAEKGKIKVRVHPWHSRHGAHLFHKQNKAFLHLLFNEDELNKSGITGPYTRKVLHPLAEYQSYFLKGGLGVLERKIFRRDYEAFFSYSPFREMIVNNWRNSPYDPSLRNGSGFPSYCLDIEFIDYTLFVPGKKN